MSKIANALIKRLKELNEWEKVLEKKGGYHTPFWKTILEPIFDNNLVHDLDRENIGNRAIQNAKENFRKENGMKETEPSFDITNEATKETGIENDLFPHLTDEEKNNLAKAEEAHKKEEAERQRMLEQGARKVVEQDILIDDAHSGRISGEKLDRISKKNFSGEFQSLKMPKKDLPENTSEFKFR